LSFTVQSSWLGRWGNLRLKLEAWFKVFGLRQRCK
jgi:hypothetical protein